MQTVTLTVTATSIKIALTSPPMLIEVRAVARGKRHVVTAFRDDAAGPARQAGVFGAYGSPERAMEVALEVAQVLAIGLAVAAQRREVSMPTTVVPPSMSPRTCDLIEQAEDVVKRISKVFRKDKGNADAEDKTTIAA